MSKAGETKQQSFWRLSVTAFFVANGLFLGTWVARIPSVRDSLEATRWEIGLILFGLAGGSILGLFLAPLIAKFISSRTALISGYQIMAGSVIVLGFAAGIIQSQFLAFLAITLGGICYGIGDVIINVEGAKLERLQKRSLLTGMHAGFSGGTVFASSLGTLAEYLAIPLETNFLVMGLLMAVLTVFASFGIPKPSEDMSVAKTVETSKPKSSWLDYRLLLIGLMILGVSFAEGSAEDWIGIAIVDGHGLDNALGSLALTVFVLAMFVIRVIGGKLIDNYGGGLIIRLSVLTAIAGTLLFILSNQYWLVLLGTLFWGLGSGLAFPLGVSAAAKNSADPAKRVTVVSIIGYTAFVLGPPIIGAISELVSILTTLWLVVALLIVSWLASWVLPSKETEDLTIEEYI